MLAKALPTKDVVLGCGHAFHLFEVHSFEDAPQIHFHFLTDDKTHQEQGFGTVEFCCHGCGEAILLHYSEGVRPKANCHLRDSFIKKHRNCPDFDGESYCPNFRSTFQTIDLRRGSAPGSKRTQPKALKLKCTNRRKRAVAP